MDCRGCRLKQSVCTVDKVTTAGLVDLRMTGVPSSQSHGVQTSFFTHFRTSHCFSNKSGRKTEQVLELCERVNADPLRRLCLHASIGMHPVKADLDTLEGILQLIDNNSESIVCVGEVGLDYSRHVIGATGDACERAKEVQREVFGRQARCAEVSYIIQYL